MTHWRKPRDCPQAAHEAWCVHPKCDCEPEHWANYDEFMLLKPREDRIIRNVKIVIGALLMLFLLLGFAYGSEPFYCKPLEKFDRSCYGVKMAVATLGKDRAISIAKKCGATEAEIAQAEECLRIPVTQPEKQ